MAHSISAIVAEAPVDGAAAEALGLPLFERGGFVVVALDDGHARAWSQRLGVSDGRLSEDIPHDSPLTLEFAKRLGLGRFALVRTEYFGGIGEQWATVYEGGARVLSVTPGGINAALRAIGVVAAPGLDEFDTVGLGRHRSFAHLFGRNRRA